MFFQRNGILHIIVTTGPMKILWFSISKKLLFLIYTCVREELNKPEPAALAIFYNFKGQLTEKILQKLEDNNIQSILVPANCTDLL